MSDRIADTKGLGFAGVGIYYLGFGLARSFYPFESLWSTFGTVMSLATAIVMLVAGVTCLLRLERLHGAFFIFLGALTLAGPAMMQNVWAGPSALEGTEGSLYWNGWVIVGFALFLLPLGIGALRGKEVNQSGSVAMLMLGVAFLINGAGHLGGSSVLNVLTFVDAGVTLIAVAAAFWTAGHLLIREEGDSQIKEAS